MSVLPFEELVYKVTITHINHMVPMVWEIVRRTNRLGTRLRGSGVSTWRRHF